MYLAYSFRISSVHPYLRSTRKKEKKRRARPKNKWLKANCIHFKYSRFSPKDINNKRTKGIKSAIFLSLAFLPLPSPFFCCCCCWRELPFIPFTFAIANNYTLEWALLLLFPRSLYAEKNEQPQPIVPHPVPTPTQSSFKR